VADEWGSDLEVRGGASGGGSLCPQAVAGQLVLCFAFCLKDSGSGLKQVLLWGVAPTRTWRVGMIQVWSGTGTCSVRGSGRTAADRVALPTRGEPGCPPSRLRRRWPACNRLFQASASVSQASVGCAKGSFASLQRRDDVISTITFNAPFVAA